MKGVNRKKTPKYFALLLIFAIGIGLVALGWVVSRDKAVNEEPVPFDGARAMQDVLYQVELGARVPGSQAHEKTVDYIVAELTEAGWEAEVSESEWGGQKVRNVIARIGEGEPWTLLGAHYDSRMVADRDPAPENRQLPVPGANDGASGVAVLLELARVLPSRLEQSKQSGQVWLVFFDAEDNGNLPGWDWSLGSNAFVASLREKPDAVVIVDMIGDADLNVYMEKNSDPELTEQIWQKAAALGYATQFIPVYKYRITDDHVPFLQAGIPAVDLIDFDYSYWHTINDTVDKVSQQSLQILGDVLLSWLTGQ